MQQRTNNTRRDGVTAMSFSYAVIRHTADGWRVCVNDYAKDHEATAKTLPEIVTQAKRLIEQCQKETP
jgi:hypothetical protein